MGLKAGLLVCTAMFSSVAMAVNVRTSVSVPDKKDCDLRANGVENYRDLVQKVSIKGNDDRVPDETAETSGALKLICKDGSGKAKSVGSAQLIQPGNVISTSAHNFIDKNCKKIFDPSNCAVVQLRGGGADFFYLDGTASKLGSDCPHQNGKDDWAVARLKQSVSATAARICDPRNVSKGENVRMVAANESGQAAGDMRRKVQTCKVILGDDGGRVFRTDCDSKDGNSGSGVFKGDCMVGIHNATGNDFGDTPADYQKADPYMNYGQVLRIDEEIFSAIKSVSK